MNRPRITGIVSGIAASVAAFLVVSRWHLAGTLTGAAIMPVIYTLVSHGSQEGLSELGRRVRRTVRRQHDELRAHPNEPTTTQPALPASESVTSSWSARQRGQWMLLGISVVALGVSIWSVAVRDPGERVVVQQKVIEKTVTVTAGASDSAGPQSDETTNSQASDKGVAADASTSTTTTTAVGQDDASVGDGPSSPATTAGGSSTGGGAGVPTSVTTSTSTSVANPPTSITP
jgi:hypothetical protein